MKEVPLDSASSENPVETGSEASAGNAVRSKAGYFCFIAAVSLLSVLLVCLIYPPRLVLWKGLHVPEAAFTPEVNRAMDMLKQLDSPMNPVVNPSNKVIRWRLLFPVLWHGLHLPKTLFLMMPCLGCLLSLGMIAHVAYGATKNRLLTSAVAIVLSASSWLFASIGWLAYFDSWLVFGLLTAGFVRSRFVLLAVCLLCPWVDERFIIALPLCLMIRFAYFDMTFSRDMKEMVRELLLAASSIASYAILRLILSMTFKEDHSIWYLSNQLALSNIASVTIPHYLEGIWYGIRGGIIFLGVFLWLGCSGRPWTWCILLWGILLSTLVIGLVIAGDLSRSMEVFIPAALSGAVLAARKRPLLLKIILAVAVPIALLTPAKHVVSSFKVSTRINSLSTELGMYRNPPEFLRPEFYLAKAGQLAEQGMFDKALHCIDNALALDSSLPQAYYCRALIRSAGGDPGKALADLDKAIILGPDFADALYLRGVLRQSSNEMEAARTDFKNALKVSSPDWPRRNECRERVEGFPGD